jgi:UDP-N-acetyl-D-galactosamine dehydrogenase
MGFTFKENVADIRNSKVANIIKELQSYRVQVDVVDPYANADELEHEYHIELKDEPQGKYDAIVVAVAHKQYRECTEKDFLKLSNDKGILIDIKGLYKDNIKELTYWSL